MVAFYNDESLPSGFSNCFVFSPKIQVRFFFSFFSPFSFSKFRDTLSLKRLSRGVYLPLARDQGFRPLCNQFYMSHFWFCRIVADFDNGIPQGNCRGGNKFQLRRCRRSFPGSVILQYVSGTFSNPPFLYCICSGSCG